MKYVLSISAALLAGALLLVGDEAAPATYVDHDKVGTAFTKGGSLAKGKDFTASGARRTGPGQVEIHEKETDIFYIIDGEATFVTGGTMIGGKQTKENQFLGTDIEGGVTAGGGHRGRFRRSGLSVNLLDPEPTKPSSHSSTGVEIVRV